MNDYIRREDAVDTIKKNFKYLPGYMNATINYIKELSSVDVVQVVHGRWENYSPITIKCSRCGHVIHDWRYSECKYCPNCGAKMDGEREE